MAFLGHRRIPSEATKSRLLDTHAARVLGGKRKQGTPTAAVAKKTPEAQTGAPAKTETHRNSKKAGTKSCEETKTAPKGGLKVHGSSEGIRTLDLRLERAAS